METNPKAPAKRRWQAMWTQMKNDRLFYLMLAPAIVYFLVFCYYPIIEARLAFEDFRFIGANEWVGLKHFNELFDSQAFIRVLINTVIISTMKIVFYFPVPILLSLLINELRTTWFRKYVQSVVYLPHFLSWVVIAGVFITILSPASGALAEIAKTMGLKPIAFLTNQSWIRWILVLTEMWRSAGWDTMLYVAALLAINPSLYEAAKLDGAGRVRQMIYVTLPELKSTIIIVFILNLGFFMNAGFDQVFNLMNDSVISTIDILDIYVYRIGLLNGEVSYATAVGLFKGIIGLILILASHFILKKKAGKGVW